MLKEFHEKMAHKQMMNATVQYITTNTSRSIDRIKCVICDLNLNYQAKNVIRLYESKRKCLSGCVAVAVTILLLILVFCTIAQPKNQRDKETNLEEQHTKTLGKKQSYFTRTTQHLKNIMAQTLSSEVAYDQIISKPLTYQTTYTTQGDVTTRTVDNPSKDVASVAITTTPKQTTRHSLKSEHRAATPSPPTSTNPLSITKNIQAIKSRFTVTHGYGFREYRPSDCKKAKCLFNSVAQKILVSDEINWNYPRTLSSTLLQSNNPHNSQVRLESFKNIPRLPDWNKKNTAALSVYVSLLKQFASNLRLFIRDINDQGTVITVNKTELKLFFRSIIYLNTMLETAQEKLINDCFEVKGKVETIEYMQGYNELRLKQFTKQESLVIIMQQLDFVFSKIKEDFFKRQMCLGLIQCENPRN